jgi:hypothetical protein
MRPLFQIFFFLVWMAGSTACKDKAAPAIPKPVIRGVQFHSLPLSPEKIRGTYTGDFKGSPIALTFRYISANNISGYNTHKGLKRNISGSIVSSGNKLHVQVSEPGTNQYDGHFDLWIDTTTWSGKGVWKPKEKGDDVSFTFKKEVTDDGVYNELYSMFTDSASNIMQIKSNGTCVYSYLIDSTNQQQTVQGNFKLRKDSTLEVFWQKNTVFPKGKSVFRLQQVRTNPDEEYFELGLVGEGRIFTNYVY